MKTKNYFRYLRTEVAKSPPDQLTRVHLLVMRAMLFDALEVCEWLEASSTGQETDASEHLRELLQLRLERLPVPPRRRKRKGKGT